MGPCRSLEVCYCMVKVARLGQGCGTHIRSRRLWKDKVSIGLLSRLYPGGGCGKSGYGVGCQGSSALTSCWPKGQLLTVFLLY